MSTIVFIMVPEVGHVNSTFKLGKKLLNRGHRVVHVGIPDMKELVTEQGIEYYSIGEKQFPEGYLEQRNQGYAEGNILDAFRIRCDYIKRMGNMLDELYETEFDSLISKLQPDIFITDALFPYGGIFAASTDIPVLSLSTTLPVEFDINTPPLTSYCLPTSDWKSKINIGIKWFLRLLSYVGQLPIAVALYKEIKKQVKQWNFPQDKIQYLTSFLPYAKLDELVLCPAEFDFPSVNKENRYYIGSIVDLDRKEADFPWEKIDLSKKLIYCSFGTEAFDANRVQTLLQRIIDIVADHSEWQLIMTTGSHLAAEEFSGVADNIHLVEYAPQIKILQKADLFISHGGLNSIKEAIMSQVPLIIMPLGRDQPGNASRVEYHGLGFALPPDKAKKSKLATMISKALTSDKLRNNLEQMANVFYEAEAEDRGVQTIEDYINQADRQIIES